MKLSSVDNPSAKSVVAAGVGCTYTADWAWSCRVMETRYSEPLSVASCIISVAVFLSEKGSEVAVWRVPVRTRAAVERCDAPKLFPR